MIKTRARSPLTCEFHDADGASDVSSDTLASITFGEHSDAPGLRNGVPHLPLRMVDDPGSAFSESWITDGPINSGEVDGLVYAHDHHRLFCAGRIAPSGNYTNETRAKYSTAFELIDSLGFPHLFRMWNYIGDINGDNAEGLETYRDFCRGRSEAFTTFNKAIPAATGVGARASGISFYFLSTGDATTTHIENPRQVPAYRYPARYGPKSPTFARATHVASSSETDDFGTLFVAGTASILGHETVHAGNLDRQCDVALANVAYLVGEHNLSKYCPGLSYRLPDMEMIKVYVRHREHLSHIRNRCEAVFGSDTDIRYLNVDICRKDLLVEIEGIFHHRRSADAETPASSGSSQLPPTGRNAAIDAEDDK